MNEHANSKSALVLVVAIDSSPHADRVIATAAALAQGKPGAVLHLVHVVDPAAEMSAVPVVQAYVESMTRHSEYLDARAQEARAASGATVVGHLQEGEPWRTIVQTAANVDADLVVMGTHGRRGLARMMMGSVAEQVMRRAACPVLVVREKSHETAHEPEIEPPCADCVQTQRATGGQSLWCARHAQHHPRAHLHYAGQDPFASGPTLGRS